MFDLEKSIAEWRGQMLAAGIKTPVPLEELENHLREDVEERVRSGATAQQAFDTTVRQIGRGEMLQPEFARAGETIYERIETTLLRSRWNSQLSTRHEYEHLKLES